MCIRDRYEAFSRVYNKTYREKISPVADFWNDKLSQYERFDDGWDIGEPDDEQSEGTEEEKMCIRDRACIMSYLLPRQM